MDLGEFNRLEVIDHTHTGGGRAFVKWEDFDFNVSVDEQDGKRTLKIFLSEVTDESTDESGSGVKTPQPTH